jgi:alkylated DNA repair dioxygenase AlkB
LLEAYIFSIQNYAPHTPQHFPEGFTYATEIISAAEEQKLIETIRSLPFREFEFRGFLGKRRTVSFGWRYDFNERKLQQAEKIPTFFLSIRKKAARFASLAEARLQHVLVTEYAPSAAIGWHKDRPEFEDVIGISLGAPCVFRFRRKQGTRWERTSIKLQSCSAYLMRGPARWDWQHCIRPVDKLRYSVTFRTLRDSKA